MHSVAQLKTGELAGIKCLTLSENLTVFPLEILTLANTLEVLDVSNNQLSSLPDEFAQLTKLKIIFASNNEFEHLPDVLGLCPNLEMVGFKANKIKQVSEKSLPKKLRWLILTDNCIDALPERLGECIKLEKLALAGNQLTQLPQSFDKLTNLALLRISANNLAHFPRQLFKLPKLAWLAFSGNPFCQTDLVFDEVPMFSSENIVLGQVLGQGASGVISQGRFHRQDQRFPEQVAVKVFKGQVTSDGYPQDELNACLKVGRHPNLVQSLGQIIEPNYLALIMNLIPSHYTNLGLPPSLQTCSRDTFDIGFTLPIIKIDKVISQMMAVFEHLHNNEVCHGDLYAHNTLIDDNANIIFGDFGAASMYHMLNEHERAGIKVIEQRALNYFIADLLSICCLEDKNTELFIALEKQVKNSVG